MALHAYTFAQLKNEAEHVIGGAPDARIDTGRLVNGVLDFVATSHAWSWRTAITTLSTVADEGRISLPDDFGELIDLVGYQLPLTAVKKARAQTVMRARIHGIQNDASLIYFIGQAPQADAAVIPGRVLEVAPLPAASTADAFYLTYRKLIPILAGDSDVPAIPYGMHEMLVYLVRGHSALRTKGDGGVDLQIGMSLYHDFKANDGLVDGPAGLEMTDQLESGDDGIWHLSPHTSIAMPGDP